MKKKIFITLGIAMMILSVSQFASDYTESIRPVIISLGSIFGAMVCFWLATNKLIEEVDDDDDDRD